MGGGAQLADIQITSIISKGDELAARNTRRQPSDEEIWDHARKRNWVVLTRDTDFFDRIMLEGPPPKVIWVRLGNIRRKELESMLLHLWPRLLEMIEANDLVEVHPDSLESFSRANP